MTTLPLEDHSLSAEVRETIAPPTRAWAQTTFNLDPKWGIDYFIRFFHRPLRQHICIEEATALECACGNGFNAIAFLLAGGKSIVGYDKTPERVEIATELAKRLKLSDRARFEVCDIHELPSEKKDIAFTLQTLEHVPRPLEALRSLADRARRSLVLSTPNKLFPRDGHDTKLLFAHWLPRDLRKRYATLRNAPVNQLCQFLSPLEIAKTLPDFERVTSYYNFETLEEWLDCYPCYFPYSVGGRWEADRRSDPKWMLASRLTKLPLLGRHAGMLTPVIEGIWTRR